MVHTLIKTSTCDEVKKHIRLKTKIIANLEQSQPIVDEIICAGDPIAVDCEGVNLGVGGSISTVQIACDGGDVFIFDVLAVPAIGKILKNLLENDQIIKVIHDCRNDSVCLFNQFGILLTNVFDTQAAHTVIKLNGATPSEAKVDHIGLNRLCEKYNAICNPFKAQLEKVYRYDNKFWNRRPLTEEMINYAACDVLCLLPTIYHELKSQIKEECLQLFNDLCNKQIRTNLEPKKSTKGESVKPWELETLKDKIRNWRHLWLSVREVQLLKHIDLTAEDVKKLKSFPKIARRIEHLDLLKRPGSGRKSNSQSRTRTTVVGTNSRRIQSFIKYV